MAQSAVGEDREWYVNNRDTLMDMTSAVGNLHKALQAQDAVNVARFSFDVSRPAGDVIASDPPEQVEGLARLAMTISGSADEAVITGDYSEINDLYQLWLVAMAAVVEAAGEAADG